MKVLSIVLSIILLMVFSAPVLAATNDSIDELFGYHPPDYREKWIQCVDREVKLRESCTNEIDELNAKLEEGKGSNGFFILLGALGIRFFAVK